ncbi:MAG: hypothetical protein R2748_09230 [Bryobacterales bacterium]
MRRSSSPKPRSCPAIAFAIEPKTRQDEDRLSAAIHRVLEEDPSLNFYRDEQNGRVPRSPATASSTSK